MRANNRDLTKASSMTCPNGASSDFSAAVQLSKGAAFLKLEIQLVLQFAQRT